AYSSAMLENNKAALCLTGESETDSSLQTSSVHGYNASAFHQRCNRQGPTLQLTDDSLLNHGGSPLAQTQSSQELTAHAFIFTSSGSPHFQGKIPVCFKVNSGYNARIDDTGVPNFGQQLYFCYNNQPVVYNSGSNAVSLNTATMYGNDTQLSECEVYKVKQSKSISAIHKQWRNVLWTAKDELMEMIRNHKPLVTSVSRVRILMIGPVGAGKSSFFNSINSIFMSRITSKAMSGSAGTSLTTQFRTYPVKDGREGKPLPFVLCDTMGLEEQSGAGLDIEDISSILQGHVPDRYKFNPMAPFQPDEQKASRPASLQEKIHCVVYVIDSTRISLMSDKLQEKLASIRRKVNSLGIAQIVLMTKVDEACPLVEKDLQSLYVSSYIKSKVQEVSSRLGVPVSCVLPVKNYSQELELELNCDVLLLTALQQMLNFADDYLDDVCSMEDNVF
uniref:Interferon-induced protein 44-like n=1 Tax=Sinocyclocheilus grahami TaxID=75366 RepID=A0A672NYA4_SINGR